MRAESLGVLTKVLSGQNASYYGAYSDEVIASIELQVNRESE